MEKNVGTIDAWLRALAGLVLIVFLFAEAGPWRWLGLLGFVLLGTALFRTCPLYGALGMNTRHFKNLGSGKR